MVARKLDCTGQKFGRLTVVRESGRCPKTNRPLWLLRCDCGNTIERTRNSFDRKDTNSSCGCFRKELNARITANRRKPDCTGQRFGRLVVLGKGGTIPDRNSYRQLWKLQCDCGKIIQIQRSSFEDKGQISCGCAKRLGLVDNKRRPHNITGQKFGTLTAIALTGKKKDSKPTWLFQCDCGRMSEKSLSQIRRCQYYGIRINCGDRIKHPDRWLTYPATPNPYPKEAGDLFVKYLHLTNLTYPVFVDSAVEDEKRDRLERAAWIIAYRRQQGEEIPELLESGIINKYLRYCSISVFWKRRLESSGGMTYTQFGEKKEIGDTMTDATLNDYPVIETQGINLTSTNPLKRLKFRRC